ncbi:MAG: hypothetical protein AAGA43_15730 [Bacteroidota bacterium]
MNRDLLNKLVFDQIDQLYGLVRAIADTYLVDARSLAAALILVYLSVKAYGIMTGDERFEIMPLVRPFGIVLVILLWQPFIDVLEAPILALENKSEQFTEAKIDRVNQLYKIRNDRLTDLYTKLWSETSELEDAKEDDSFFPSLPSIEEFRNKINAAFVYLQAKLKWALYAVLEFIVIMLFQGMIYLIFYLKVIIAGLLIALGPFAFAVSIIPGFRSSYLKWISRFVSTLLYGVMGYIVLLVALTHVENAVSREIATLNVILQGTPESDVLFYVYTAGHNSSEYSFIVALLVGALGMLAVPIISNWIITSASSSSVANKAVNAAQTAAAAGTKLIGI